MRKPTADANKQLCDRNYFVCAKPTRTQSHRRCDYRAEYRSYYVKFADSASLKILEPKATVLTMSFEKERIWRAIRGNLGLLYRVKVISVY
jgi:hypothetical protein